MSRRAFALKGGIVASGVSVMGSSLITEPAQGLFSLRSEERRVGKEC